jgi:hypothetical protein
MTKEEALRVMKLLSAMESWAFSQTNRIPDYLIEDIGTAMAVLERIILANQQQPPNLITHSAQSAGNPPDF